MGMSSFVGDPIATVPWDQEQEFPQGSPEGTPEESESSLPGDQIHVDFSRKTSFYPGKTPKGKIPRPHG